jgi:hypothetical protein
MTTDKLAGITDPCLNFARAIVCDDDQKGPYPEKPEVLSGHQARSSERDPVSGLHQGQRSYVPRKQAGHMTATQIDQNHLNLILANQEPSTHDNTLRLTPAFLQFVNKSNVPGKIRADTFPGQAEFLQCVLELAEFVFWIASVPVEHALQ